MIVIVDHIFNRILNIDPIRRQSLISFLSLTSLTFIGYLATIYFAHTLGPAILGSYFLFLAYFGIFDLIGDGGFGGAAVKRISEGKEESTYFTAFIFLRVILVSGAIILLLLLKPFIVDLTEDQLVPWLILAMIVGTIFSIVNSGVYGTKQVGVTQISAFINTVTKIVIQVIATFLGFEAAGLAGGFIAGLISGIIVNYRYLPLKISSFQTRHLKSLFSFSFWTFLAASGSLVFTYADVILIGYFMSNTDVGVYRLAYQLAALGSFVTLALHNVLYPQISHWHAKGDLTPIGKSLSRAITYSFLLAIPVLAGGIILGDQLLYYLYGADFQAGTSAFIVLLFVQIGTIFMFLQTMCLNAIDMPRKSFYATAAAATVNILLNLALIPLLGILGAAFATLCSIGLNGILSYWFLGSTIQVRIERVPLRNILLAAFAMSGIVILFRLTIGISNVYLLIIAVAIGALVYFPVLFFLDRSIKDELKEILLKLGIPIPAFI
jgi:O-antigen/teichoic acid export membrane protein